MSLLNVFDLSSSGMAAQTVRLNTIASNIANAQRFDQGTISFTNSSLDLAIDGNGLFVLSDGGTRTYTRAGAFVLDNEGFITNSDGARVQGFTANGSGTLSGILGDLQINTANLPPLQTSLVEANVNLDARAGVLSELGSSLGTTGSSIGRAQLAGEEKILNDYVQHD